MIYHGRKTNNLDDLPTVVTKVVTKLRPRQDKFDSIVVRGLSGVLVGTPVALRLKKPLVVVRKGSERTHARSEGWGQVVNGERLGKRWLFLDDLTSQGGTLRACKRVLKDRGTHVATFLYQHMTWQEHG